MCCSAITLSGPRSSGAVLQKYSWRTMVLLIAPWYLHAQGIVAGDTVGGLAAGSNTMLLPITTCTISALNALSPVARVQDLRCQRRRVSTCALCLVAAWSASY